MKIALPKNSRLQTGQKKKKRIHYRLTDSRLSVEKKIPREEKHGQERVAGHR